MGKITTLFREGRHEELWQLCCGFLDLSLEDAMSIQKRLLLEQMELLSRCELGRVVMKGANPTTVEEFRARVPLTTYADYAPYLLERRADALPAKPLTWSRTSGRSGEFPAKWVPVTAGQYEELGVVVFGIMLLAGCRRKGEVRVKMHDKFLYTMAPAPYFSGVSGRRVADEEVFDFLPPFEEAEKMEFTDRIATGFEMALFEGLDWFGGLTSVLAAVGEQFSSGGGKLDMKPFLKKPSRLLKLLSGVTKAKLGRRALLPRDIWSVKGIMAGGADTPIFRDKIVRMWGVQPLETYGCTEAGMLALQTWDYKGMTFIPHLNFLEFIPEKESVKLREDPAYRPRILLLDEVEPGQNYELIITNFYGGPLVRYRLGDMVWITALRNEDLGIDMPQVEFFSRIDDIVDLAGFTRLTEKIIWQAVENLGAPYVDWAARKEMREEPVLHVYLELGKDADLSSKDVTSRLHEGLMALDTNYADLVSMTRLKPLRVTLLPSGAFQAYMKRQQAQGADLAHLKIPHINPTDGMVDFLLSGGKAPPVPTPGARVPRPEAVS